MTTANETQPLKAPFPWFGGKARVSHIVWQRFGEVDNYVEPFFGSGAVLLNAPRVHRTETVNDADGFVANFWRALKHDPEAVAHHADNPVNENDLHARHIWLVEQRETFTAQMDADPDFYDAKIAGWWCWGICCWIGSGWCSGDGPWRAVIDDDGRRQLVHLGDAGQEASTASESDGLIEYMAALARRLFRVRVCCGDWSRVCGPTVTVKQGLTAVFLDPPYAAEAERCDRLYRCDSLSIAHDVREWCLENGDDPQMRIALCGYEGEHVMPDSWECHEWKTAGGYSSQGNGDNVNKHKERIWFSPHCIKPKTERMLFD